MNQYTTSAFVIFFSIGASFHWYDRTPDRNWAVLSGPDISVADNQLVTTKWVLPCNIIKGIIVNIIIDISHIIWYTCATSSFFSFLICQRHNGWWCCAGLHYLNNCCLYFAFKYFNGAGKISGTLMNIMHPSTADTIWQCQLKLEIYKFDKLRIYGRAVELDCLRLRLKCALWHGWWVCILLWYVY